MRLLAASAVFLACLFGGARAVVGQGIAGQAVAQATPSPAVTTPAPGSSPAPASFTVHADLQTTLIDQSTAGSGQITPEAPGFENGSPVSPLTPYDVMSSAPQVPGVAGVAQLLLTPAYATKNYTIGATFGAAYVTGSSTNASYWGEDLMPTINPHVGFHAYPYAIQFPTHAGQDDGTGVRGSILSGSIATADGNAFLRAGWFDLTQTDRFVFVAPAITNVPPAVGMLTAETLGSMPSLDWWPTASPTLPLDGLDFVGKRGLATLELTDAALPSLPGVGQRVTMGSLVVDHGGGLRYSAEVVHVSTGGDLVPTTVYSGIDATLYPSYQGTLPTSFVGGQRQTNLGLAANFAATKTIAAVAEYGHSTYDADSVARPGTERPGNYYHLGLSAKVGKVAATLDGYRNEPTYASILLPYGAPENVWSIAYAWPGQWLKSNYQTIDNSAVNVNRQGGRAGLSYAGGSVEVHATAAIFYQIAPITYTQSQQAGFVDGFFLPQPDSAPTQGNQHQYGVWIAWHPKPLDLTLDYADDMMHRDNAAQFPADAVSYDAPELVLTASHNFRKRLIVAGGFGRYAMRGTFGTGGYTNIDFQQNTGFLGAQLLEGAYTGTLLQVRRGSLAGAPSTYQGPSPAFTGTLFVLEQRVKL